MTTSYPSTQLLIANEWVDAKSGKTLDVRNPATGQVIGKVAHAGIADLDRCAALRRRASKPGATCRPTSAPRSCAAPPA